MTADIRNTRFFRLAGDATISLDAAQGLYTGTISTENIGRDGHKVVTKGIRFANFMAAGGPVLFAHDASTPPVAATVKLWAASSPSAMRAAWRYANRDSNPLAGTLEDLTKVGGLRGLSIGWIPIKWSVSADRARNGGIDFTEIDLLEFSIVSIPCLPQALIDAPSRGIDIRPVREWAERALDTGYVGAPRGEIEAVYRSCGGPLVRAGKTFSAANQATIRAAADHVRSANEHLDRLMGQCDRDDGGDERTAAKPKSWEQLRAIARARALKLKATK